MQKLWKTLIEGPPGVRLMVAALLVLLPIAPAAANTFVWDQFSSATWSDEDNWTPAAECTSDCYPHTTDDDAVITSVADSPIELDDDYTIDDMTITAYEPERSIRSNSASVARELSCDSIVITDANDIFVWDKVTVIARRSNDP